jgi:cob(I)alamin adenosyltransferase
LFGGKRVSKADLRVDVYGDIDELTSNLGLAVSKISKPDEKEYIINIQKELYEIMGLLAGAKTDLSFLEYAVSSFENKIDKLEAELPPLHRFILPGGSETSSLLHVARSICRRSERKAVLLYQRDKDDEKLVKILKYLNRLSDLLFMLARWHGRENEIIT